jgi:hypothetical protein
MIDDAAKLVATYEARQKISHLCRAPAKPSELIAPSWPLQRWGIDIVGKLTLAQGSYTFAIVAVEYFTKWIEAKPVINITSATIQKFLLQNIIYHYGLPQQITVDNAKYFDSVIFKDFCHQIRMKVSFASVNHPQSNGAVEQTNALIFEAIKKILEGEKKDKWVEVMPRAVWSHNTMVCRATNFTPFQLLFGAEAVLPEEIKHQSLCITAEAPPCPNEVEEKDLLESERLKAVTNLQKYQDETRNWRDPKVKKRDFDVGNLVLLRSPRTESSGKLESKWEGTYVIIEKTRPRVYHLADSQGPMLEHSWNAGNLHRFYI